MSLQKIGFIGLGLIGGSIAKKLHALHPELTMIATAHHTETVADAYKEHLIVNNTPCELKDFADCDYIFLCTPTRKNIEYLQQLKDVISPDCIITDVGSVKTEIHREVEKLGLEANFIGGHPMAGSEKTGLSNASETLLENAYYIITPTGKSPAPAVEELTELVRSLGAIPLVLGYEQHDYATAAISHCLLYTSPSPRDPSLDLVCRLLLEKIFFNDTATTEIYTVASSSAASDVYKRQLWKS